jgi:hypothetical protein
MIACCRELCYGKMRVVHLGFLHAQDIRTMLLKPRNDDRQARPDGIHIEGRNFEDAHVEIPFISMK